MYIHCSSTLFIIKGYSPKLELLNTNLVSHIRTQDVDNKLGILLRFGKGKLIRSISNIPKK